MRVLPLKRAIVLVLQEKAEIVEDSGGMIRSENLAITLPKVIRLLYYVKIPYRKKVPLSNRTVLARDNHKCAYCSEKATTIDHVWPKAKGGIHDWTNVVAACQPCNQRKGDRTLEQMNWTLPYKPDRPTTRKWVVVGRVEESWVPYLGAVTA
jgi:5-methylcytosine-specific restriction endonuclease McrA